MNAVLEEQQTTAPSRQKIVRRFVLALLVLLSALIGSFSGLIFVYSTDLPQIEQLEHYRPISSTELYDVHGRVIGSFALQRRVIATYDDFPRVLTDALVSTEDKDFFRHGGVNIWRIVGAAYRDVESGGKVQGASTLTMQLARNLFLSQDRSFHRKIQEILLAIQIERRFTKEQILTLYANQIYLGHGVYGFEAASEFYFSKPAKQLILPEAALIVGLPKAPVNYSPISHPDRALKRRNMKAAFGWLYGGIIGGLGYIGTAMHGYAAQGFNMHTSAYASIYLALTGFHLLHVVAGVIMLLGLYFGLRSPAFRVDKHDAAEAITYYWHFVTFMWFGIYSTVYWIR